MWRRKKGENNPFSISGVGILWITVGGLALDVGKRVKEPCNSLAGQSGSLMDRLENPLSRGIQVELILPSGGWARQALRFLPSLFFTVYCEHPHAQGRFWLGLALQLLLWRRGAAPSPAELAGTQSCLLEMTNSCSSPLLAPLK